MGFFEYFDAGYALIMALQAIAMFTATKNDDGALGRARNLADKLRLLFRR